MTIRSVWHINNDQNREDTRLAPVGAMAGTTSGVLSIHNGVVPGYNNPLKLTSTGNMTAQIEMGRATVQGAAAQGSYPVVITAPEALTFQPGHATLPRIDSVMIVIRDDPYDSTGFFDVRVLVVQGTAATTPVAPALPTQASLRLYDVTVQAGASSGGTGINWTSGVTDRRTYSVAVGGISLGAAPGVHAGQWRDSGSPTGTLQRFNGTTWESTIRLDSAGQLIVGDVNLRRDSAAVLATDGGFRAYRPTTADVSFSSRLVGDTVDRWHVFGHGTLSWGPGGSGALDTNLYRDSANVLATDDSFQVGSDLKVLGVGKTMFVRKTADETVLSSTTLQNDNELSAPVVANAVYEAELSLMAITPGGFGSDISLAWAYPTGSTAHITGVGPHNSDLASGSNSTAEFIARQGQTGTVSQAIPYGTGTVLVTILQKVLLITGSSAGNLQLQWAQNTASANSTTVKLGSWMRTERVG